MSFYIDRHDERMRGKGRKKVVDAEHLLAKWNTLRLRESWPTVTNGRKSLFGTRWSGIDTANRPCPQNVRIVHRRHVPHL